MRKMPLNLNKAKKFAKQLASEVYQNKAHFNSQVCYDKVKLAIVFHKIVMPSEGASVQNYSKSMATKITKFY